MLIRSRRPRLTISLAPLLLSPVVALANTTDVPLHLEPIHIEPFEGVVEHTAIADVNDGLFLVHNGTQYSCAPVGLSLAADGTPNAPIPVQFSNYGYQCAASVAVDHVADEALVAWHLWTGTEDHVIAILQQPETWTHHTSPGTDLGVGRVPAVVGVGQFGLLPYASPAGLVTVRFDPSNWPTHSSPIVLFQGSMASFSQTGGAFAPEVGRAMFVWRYGTVIYGRITDSIGNPVTDTLTLANSADGPSICWNGTHFVVAWSAGGSITVVRVNPNGVVIDHPISVASAPGHVPEVASIDGETLVVWIRADFQQPYRVLAARFTAAGTVLDPGGFLLYQGTRIEFSDSPNQVVGVTATSTGYYVTWIENRWSCGGIIFYLQDVMGALVSVPPYTLGPALILTGSEEQHDVTAAPVGDRFWTAWRGQTRRDAQLLAARRDVAGVLLDPQGLELAQDPSCGAAGHFSSFDPPVAAGNSGAVLTAWRNRDMNQPWWDDWKIRYCVYNAAGVLAGCNEFTSHYVFSLESHPPAVAARDSDFLLAFTAQAPNNSVIMRWAGIENAGGQSAGGSIDLGIEETLDDAASDGDGFLVSWTENGNGRDSFVGRFDGSFNFLDPAGILLAGGPGDQPPARLASNGNQYLAVWMEPGLLRAARIDPTSGSVLDPGGVPVVSLPGTAIFDLDWDGEHYILAWTENVGGQVARLKRIAPDLTSPDPLPVELAQRPDAFRTCRVASLEGVTLIAFTRHQLPDGLETGHGIIYQNPGVTAIDPSATPSYSYLGAVPNPFWNRTEIMTGTLAGRRGILRIIDVSGRLVHEAPAHEVLGSTISWDGTDATGRPLSSGTYFYEISAPDQPAVRGKLLKLR